MRKGGGGEGGAGGGREGKVCFKAIRYLVGIIV